MNVHNHEKKTFKDMTPEERSAIVEAVISGYGEYWSGKCWCKHGIDAVFGHTIYRTRPRQMVIPWDVIKPEYKWAAMDESGSLWVYEGKPKAGDSAWAYSGDFNDIGALNIDTTGIDWRESLVQRPEGV